MVAGLFRFSRPTLVPPPPFLVFGSFFCNSSGKFPWFFFFFFFEPLRLPSSPAIEKITLWVRRARVKVREFF